MMDIQTKEKFLKEYDEFTNTLYQSGKKNFPFYLLIWFEYLQSINIGVVKFVILGFMDNPNFREMYNYLVEYLYITDSDPFLEQKKVAFSVLHEVEQRCEIWNDFKFLRSTVLKVKRGGFNVDNFSPDNQYLLKFKNFSDGLREVFEKSLGITDSDSTIDHDEQREIPASDRIVKINHNAPEYQEIIEKLEELEASISKSNSIENEDKDRFQAELKAGEGILKGKTARIEVIKILLVKGLKYIIEHVVDVAIVVTAEYLLKLIFQYFGLTV